jgi:transposase-like protein
MDEPKLKPQGGVLMLRVPIDIDTKELLSSYASYRRSTINAKIFMKMAFSTNRENLKPRWSESS